MQESNLKLIPPLGYFNGDNEIGLIYPFNKEEISLKGIALDKYEVFYNEEGSVFLGFKKRGKEPIYFVCPMHILHLALSQAKEEARSINLRFVFFYVLDNIEDSQIGTTINYNFPIVELAKLLAFLS